MKSIQCFDKYIISNTKNIIHIYIYTVLIVRPMMYRTGVFYLIGRINFIFKSKRLTLLIICNDIPELYLYQIITHARSNAIPFATMVHMSSASAQLLQLTVGQANHSRY